MKFYLFRHGETEWNRLLRFQGRTDIPLNDTGKQQALELKKKFDQINIQAILSSDLLRAKETVKIVLSHLNLEVSFSSALREANLGEIEGMFKSEFDKTYGSDFWEKWKSIEDKYLDFKFPDSESPREHLTRVADHLETWATENKHLESVAVSTHGGVIWRLIHHCEPNPSLPPTIYNCSLYLVEYENNQWHFRGEI